MERQRKTAKNTSHNRRGRVKESKRSKRNRFGTVCIVIQTIASIALMIVLNLLGMIPLKYLILIAVLLFFFWCITLNSQVARRKKGTLGKVFSLLLTFCLFMGSYYVAEANDMISRITGGNYKVDKMIVAVRADDPAETLEDAADYTFGVQFSKGSDNMQAAVSDIQKQIGSEIQTRECDSVQTQAQQLLDEDGYVLQFTVENSVITRKTKRDAIPRITIESGMSGEDVVRKIELTAENTFAAEGEGNET